MSQSVRKQINIEVPPLVHAGLTKRAATMGLSVTAYAKMLLEAAYAARIGQERSEEPADKELDEQVRLVFALAGQADTVAIAKATGIPEARVLKILDAWRSTGRTKPPTRKDA